ncbi:hypothetical protein SLCG_7886 [Streptomyces lincolnensis]|nr:hypothetical protein [Streptomyces lincolnensis]AXG59041.1 hypothetical protein SLCG_7886 [Streptomyces lincolnensis]QMV11635.1 hypothetical protein GJU35_42135 [Streptomyces lincolnensis]
MDPVTLVAQALIAGASAAVSGAASAAVTDSYRALKEALTRRLSGRPEVVDRFEVLERRPGASAEELARDLVVTGAADAEVVELARRLLDLVGPAATRPAKYQGDLRQARGVQFGDGNTQHNTFG